ncbi:hypothetical protein L484_020234 [Morus notabilis]|uniref:Uncharacterized protein n=1 Tax=Morus notabilis TaxID=981085 RepID=W9RM71_9ROSA|nr:hypothetical protein L484_020234 [Morus notabilis]
MWKGDTGVGIPLGITKGAGPDAIFGDGPTDVPCPFMRVHHLNPTECASYHSNL